jgi:hypothetical protein
LMPHCLEGRFRSTLLLHLLVGGAAAGLFDTNYAEN